MRYSVTSAHKMAEELQRHADNLSSWLDDCLDQLDTAEGERYDVLDARQAVLEAALENLNQAIEELVGLEPAS